MKNKKRKSFIQWFLALFTVMFLCGFAVINSIQFIAAATALSIGIDGLTGSYDKGDWSVSGNVITGSITSTTNSSTCGDPTYTANTATLTLTNSASLAATLHYSAVKQSGNGSISPSGESTVELASGATKTFSVTSSSSSSDTSVIAITIISYTLASADFTTTFTTGAHGSYTVYSSYTEETITITGSTSLRQSTDYSYTLTATPDTNYSIRGWRIGSSCVW